MEDKTLRRFVFTKDTRADAAKICERALTAMEEAQSEPEADAILEELRLSIKQLRLARGTAEMEVTP